MFIDHAKHFESEEESIKFVKELLSNPIKYKDIEAYGEKTFHWKRGDMSTMKYGWLYTVEWNDTTVFDRLKMVIAA